MRIITITDVSERTGVPEATLRYWRHLADGTGPKSFKLGRRVVYSAEDVEAWIVEQYNAEDSRRAS